MSAVLAPLDALPRGEVTDRESFRRVSGCVAREVMDYSGPFPYIDGLLLQVTQRIGSIEVRHVARQAGASNYTLRRLIRLWLRGEAPRQTLPTGSRDASR
mgnify:CR=1 FL=1